MLIHSFLPLSSCLPLCYYKICSQILRINVCVPPPPVHMLKPSLTFIVMIFGGEAFGKQLGLDEIMILEPCLSWVFSLYGRDKSLSLPREDTTRGWPVATPGERSHQTPTLLALWSWAFQPSGLWEIIPLFKPPSLWYSVTAAWAHQDTKLKQISFFIVAVWAVDILTGS